MKNINKTEAEWKKKLTPEQFAVNSRERGTVTLLFAAANEENNNAVALKECLEKMQMQEAGFEPANP